MISDQNVALGGLYYDFENTETFDENESEFLRVFGHIPNNMFFKLLKNLPLLRQPISFSFSGEPVLNFKLNFEHPVSFLFICPTLAPPHWRKFQMNEFSTIFCGTLPDINAGLGCVYSKYFQRDHILVR